MRPCHAGARKSGSGAGTRASPFVFMRKPSVSATSDHEWPDPTARAVTPASSARRTIATTSSIERGV